MDLGISERHFLNLDGPIISSHMRAFSAKMGFAMHRRIKGRNLPASGVVRAHLITNVQAIRGDFPAEALPFMNRVGTLKQGKKSVGQQFWYRWAKTDDCSLTASLSFFRQSFAVFAITTTKDDPGWSDRPEETWRPGDFFDVEQRLIRRKQPS